MSLLLYGTEIWGAAYQGLDHIKRAFEFGYTNNLYVNYARRSYQKSRLQAMEHYHRYSFLPPFTNYYLLRNRDFCETEDMILFYLLLKQNALGDPLLIGVILILFKIVLDLKLIDEIVLASVKPHML